MKRFESKFFVKFCWIGAGCLLLWINSFSLLEMCWLTKRKDPSGRRVLFIVVNARSASSGTLKQTNPLSLSS